MHNNEIENKQINNNEVITIEYGELDKLANMLAAIYVRSYSKPDSQKFPKKLRKQYRQYVKQYVIKEEHENK